MAATRVFGVVLSELPTPGADRTVVVFTNERGRLIVKARGAKKPGNKLAPSIQPLTAATFHLAAAGKTLILSGVQVRSFHRTLRETLPSLSVAQAIAEAVDRTLPYDEPAPDVFRLTVNCLGALEKGAREGAVLQFFLANVVRLLGVAPSASACASCGRKLAPSTLIVFRPALSAYACSKCTESAKTFPAMPAGDLAVLYAAKFDGMDALPQTPEHLSRAVAVLRGGLEKYAEAKTRSLDFALEMLGRADETRVPAPDTSAPLPE